MILSSSRAHVPEKKHVSEYTGEYVGQKANRKQKQSLVLDLDNTLVHTFDDCGAYNTLGLSSAKNYDIRSRVYYMDVSDIDGPSGTQKSPVTMKKSIICGVKRPSLDLFLEYCFDRFENVIVWSAGLDKYVNNVCDELFADIGDPALIYTRDNIFWDENDNIKKPISKIIAEHPELGLSMKDTFIVDDRKDYVCDHNPHNAIIIPAFIDIDNSKALNLKILKQDDDALLRLMHWFSTPEVKKSADIRTLDKCGIFK